MLDSYKDIPHSLLYQLKYNPGIIDTPYCKTKITYADFIASGLPSPIIENYIQEKIYPLYSNTHSNAHNGILMKNLICDTKIYIRKLFNLSEDYKIIFSGNGTTGAINHLINCIDFSKFNRVIIFITNYEHYSNHLPWIELKQSNIKVEFIPFINNSPEIDLNFLYLSLKQLYNDIVEGKTLIICSISACSNINGYILPLKQIKNILNQFPNNNKYHKYLFSDYACSAPYVKIDGSILDAFFFSPHKFMGGQSTPGILIGRTCLFTKNKPFCPGGGCVISANSKKIEYEHDIERKESGGTPNIIGIIKIGKVFQLKEQLQDLIENNEKILSKLIKEKIKYYEQTYPNFKSVLYNDDSEHLPILSFHLSNLHYNFIVVLFNDLFGIQTRGGIGCCGLLAEYIEQKYKFRGWCRISFHWMHSKKTINNIFIALEHIIQYGYKYLNLYNYDKDKNLYIRK